MSGAPATGWRRHAIGILSGGLLLAALAIWLLVPPSATASSLLSACVRLGMVLGALWLALPQVGELLTRYPPWLLIALLVFAVAVILQPKTLTFLLPLALVLAAFHFFGRFTRPWAQAGRARHRPTDDSRARESTHLPPIAPPPVPGRTSPAGHVSEVSEGGKTPGR